MTLEELDKRMFELYELLKSMGVLKYKRDFANACGLPEQNLYNIKMKRNHFTLVHVANICQFYSINANWILETETELFIKANRKQTVNKIGLKKAI